MNPLLRYIFKRILLSIPVLCGIIVIVFTLMYITPGDPAYTIAGENVTPEMIEEIHEEYGLNDPYIVQLGHYFLNLLQGDLGESYITKQPVLNEILARYPTTLRLAFSGVAIGIVIGIIAGVVSAVFQYSIFDKILTMFSLFGISAPSFWIAMILVLGLSVKLGWLPPTGSYGPEYWIMPTFTLGLQASAYITRMTRSSMLEVIRQDYIRTARAKGQNEFVTVIKHALKNAMVPISTTIGIQICMFLAGSVLVETVFALPGLGKYMVDSIGLKNYPVVMGTVVWIATNCVCINLIVDMVYCLFDPRMKEMYHRRKKRVKNKNSEGKAGVSVE